MCHEDNDIIQNDTVFFVFDHPEMYPQRVSTPSMSASEMNGTVMSSLVRRVIWSGDAWFFFTGSLGVDFTAFRVIQASGHSSRYNRRMNIFLWDDLIEKNPTSMVPVHPHNKT